MGMAASQARYLSLTARMNDIEYQGQQINQQRTTLSNQCTNYYNSLLDLSVPTPPSTKDFTKTVYSGSYAGSKFTIGNVLPGKVNGTYNVALDYTKTGHSWNKSGTTNVTKGTQYFRKLDTVETLSDFKVTNNNYLYQLRSSSDETVTVYHNRQSIIDANLSTYTDIYIEMTGEQYAALDDKFKGIASTIYEVQNPGVPAENYVLDLVDQNGGIEEKDNKAINEFISDTKGTYLVKFDLVSLSDTDATKELADLLKTLEDNGKNFNAYTVNDADGNAITDRKSGQVITQQEDAACYYKSIDDTTLDSFNKLYKIYDASTGKTRVATDNDFEVNHYTGELTLKAGIEIVEACYESDYNKGDGEFVCINNGNDHLSMQPGIELEDADKSSYFDQNTEDGKALLEGLQHAFPDVWKQSNNNLSVFLNNFKVYTTTPTGSTNIQINVVRKKDLVGECKNVPVYQYTSNGTYTETDNREGAQLEFDVDGRIKKLGIPTENGWDWVELQCSETTDDAAYNDAFNQYEYQKYLYDKKQNEINAKISIVQQEDKNLELKLTRLDHERNAVNTELEAVKKVVQDNIEKGFKTFSG